MADRAGAIRLMAELASIAATPGTATDRAEALVESVRRTLPIETARVSLLDPDDGRYTHLASCGYDTPTLAYFATTAFASLIDALGVDRSPATLACREVPRVLVPADADQVRAGGLVGGLGGGLRTTDGRFLGVMSVNGPDAAHSSDAARAWFAQLLPIIAYAVDPLRQVAAIANLVHDAVAGVVLTRRGRPLPLPGLDGHPLLTAGSAAIEAATEQLEDGGVSITFLCPASVGSSGGYYRVTVLAGPVAVYRLMGMILLSPAGDLLGLTHRELTILGALVEGWPNRRIAAEFTITPRTVAAHVEHTLIKLGSPNRTTAAIRALRRGLYVPVTLTRGGCRPPR